MCWLWIHERTNWGQYFFSGLNTTLGTLGRGLFFPPVRAGLAIGLLRLHLHRREVVAVPGRGEQQAPLPRVGRRARGRHGRGVGGLRRAGRGPRFDAVVGFIQARHANTDGPEVGLKSES